MRYAVRIFLEKSKLSRTIISMHTWFDGFKIEPRLLQYGISGQAIEIDVEFTVLAEARQFASRFGGSVLKKPANKVRSAGVPPGAETEPVDLAQCAVDWELCAFVVAGEYRRVPRQVWLVFDTLARHAGQLVTRSQICEALYGDDPNGGPLMTDRIINIRIHQLRRASPWPIRTVHAMGFVLEEFKPNRPAPPVSVAAGVKRAQLMARR